MEKRTLRIGFIVTVISVALLGVIALQIYLLVISYEQKEQAFDRNVRNALNDVVAQIEKNEASSKIFSVAMHYPTAAAKSISPSVRKRDSLRIRREETRQFSWIIADTLAGDSGKTVRMELFHSAGIDTLTTVMVQGKKGSATSTKSFGYKYSTGENGMQLQTRLNDSLTVMLLDTSKRRRGEIVAKVVDKLLLLETLPLEERIRKSTIDSLLGRSLAGYGLRLPYHFAVVMGARDSVVMTNDTLAAIGSAGTRAQLFPNDVLSAGYELVLLFPGRVTFILKEIALLIVLSVFFIGIVLVSFVAVVRTIVLQRRIAASIINFINNMTHEFKTPISTIALATEAIMQPAVLRNKSKVVQYNAIVADENTRMKKQVDTILQMAVLEEGENELKRSPVDMHEVIGQAVKNLSLRIERRRGTLTMDLGAHQPVVHGDPVHLTNILNNILDNAEKYSTGPPAIVIKTSHRDEMLVITVSDNGIGIGAEYIDRVFDKYFRVPTGNTHDVKGFGLGLSYVKMIAEAHNGMVSINSTPGIGTSIEIVLPITNN